MALLSTGARQLLGRVGLFNANGSVATCGIIVQAAYEPGEEMVSVTMSGMLTNMVSVLEFSDTPVEDEKRVGTIIDVSNSTSELKSGTMMSSAGTTIGMYAIQMVRPLTCVDKSEGATGEIWMRVRTREDVVCDLVWGHHRQHNTKGACHMFPSAWNWAPVHTVTRLPRTPAVQMFLEAKAVEDAEKAAVARAAAATTAVAAATAAAVAAPDAMPPPLPKGPTIVPRKTAKRNAKRRKGD
jgi:hypothetical protein